ncbi:S24 family peptidase [Spirosoma humi]
MKVAAGTPTILDEPDYYKELDTFTFPSYLFRGSLVSLQVRGDSMHPTIKQGDFVIGRQTEQLGDLRNSEVYIIVYQQDHRVHFTVKRCYYFTGDDSLSIQPDNSNYPSSSIPISGILKLYHVQGCLTT